TRVSPAYRLEMFVKTGAVGAANDHKLDIWMTQAFQRRDYVGMSLVNRQSSHGQQVAFALKTELRPVPSCSISYPGFINSIGDDRDRLQTITGCEIALIFLGDNDNMIREVNLPFAKLESDAPD